MIHGSQKHDSYMEVQKERKIRREKKVLIRGGGDRDMNE